MIYEIYKTHRKDNGEYYIGKHEHSGSGAGCHDYMGSGVLLNRKMKKHPDVWHREVLATYDSRESLDLAEAFWVGNKWTDDPKCLNLMAGGQGGHCGNYSTVSLRGHSRTANQISGDLSQAEKMREYKGNLTESQKSGYKRRSQGMLGEQHYKCDLRIHKFSHKEYGEFIGKAFEMRNKYPEVGTNIHALIIGRQKSCKGWTLVQGG